MMGDLPAIARGRVAAVALWGAALLGTARPVAAAGARPSVSYATKATMGAWQPLEPADLAKLVEATALDTLSAPGLLELRARDATADYVVELHAHVVDEAELHTLGLSFGPGRLDALPSLRVADTIPLSKLDRKQMVERVQASTRKLAAQLLGALRPHLDAAPGAAPPPPPDVPPAQWPRPVLPNAPAAELAELLSKRQETAERAIRVTIAAGGPAARRRLERCALAQPIAELRQKCLDGLGRAARTDPNTQRVVLEVYRTDRDERVVREAAEITAYFAGPMRDEAIQAWLARTAAGEPEGLLEGVGDVPNLDAAIVGCLSRAAKRERAKGACIELVEPLSYARRRAVLWPVVRELDPRSPRYLKGAGSSEGSIGTEWQRGVEALLLRATRWDPELEAVLWARWQRASSSFALDALADWGAPSPGLLDKLLEVVSTAGSPRALRGVERLIKADPSLAESARERVALLRVSGAYPKSIRGEDLERIERGGSR
jgi:hypothetical protein